MKQSLLKFLQGESNIQYKTFKARVVQVEPLRITEDCKDFLEIDNFLSEEDVQKYRKSPANYGEVTVGEWHFEASSDANPQASPVTLVVQKYKLGKPSSKAKGKPSTSLLENSDVK